MASKDVTIFISPTNGNVTVCQWRKPLSPTTDLADITPFLTQSPSC